jgi:peptidoglycan/xylan/chitin deacetylase (PgdA/CDA1 family)
VVWGTEYVPAMLDLLKGKNIRITFFIGGEWAAENPELLKRMVREGHELGNHGYHHKHHSDLSFKENCQEIIMTEEVIKEIAGVKTCLFAPP